MQAATTTQPKAESTTTYAHGALDRELFCPQLQRLLLGAASELGQRGNLAQVVASIERGGGGGGGEDPNIGMLRRLGATDNRGIDNRVRALRDLEQRFHALPRKLQATALALYQGTHRAHPTLREHFGEGQGGIAGVVLYRWQLRQAKQRVRQTDTTTLTAGLDACRSALLPIEAELATLRSLSRRPRLLDPESRPQEPSLEPELTKKQRRDARVPYMAAREQWRAQQHVLAFLAAWRLWTIDERIATLDDAAGPLRAQLAHLCADLAATAAAAGAVDDELALVKLCRGGLSKETKGELLVAAEADVRALHRAWYATAPKRSLARSADIKAFKKELWG